MATRSTRRGEGCHGFAPKLNRFVRLRDARRAELDVTGGDTFHRSRANFNRAKSTPYRPGGFHDPSTSEHRLGAQTFQRYQALTMSIIACSAARLVENALAYDKLTQD